MERLHSTGRRSDLSSSSSDISTPAKQSFTASFDVETANMRLANGQSSHELLNLEILFEHADIVVLGESHDANLNTIFLCKNIEALAARADKFAVLHERIPHDADVAECLRELPGRLAYVASKGVAIFGIETRQASGLPPFGGEAAA